jgi:hypothetical protein
VYWHAPVPVLQVPTCPAGGGQSLFVQQAAFAMQAVPHILYPFAQAYWQVPVVTVHVPTWPVPPLQSPSTQQAEVRMHPLPHVLYPVPQVKEQVPPALHAPT